MVVYTSYVYMPYLAYLCASDVRGTSFWDNVISKLMFASKSVFFDLKYKTMSKNDLDALLKKYMYFCRRNRLHYEVDFFDCDDYALLFKTVASIRLNTNAVGLAIGVVELPDGEVGGHAWNLVLTDEKSILHVEPQTYEVLRREDGKIKSIDGFKYYLKYVLW